MYGTVIFLPIFSEKITDIIFINCVYVNSTMLLDVAHPMHQFYKIKEKCNDQVFKVLYSMKWKTEEK